MESRTIYDIMGGPVYRLSLSVDRGKITLLAAHPQQTIAIWRHLRVHGTFRDMPTAVRRCAVPYPEMQMLKLGVS
jgi:hypothetical protein